MVVLADDFSAIRAQACDVMNRFVAPRAVEIDKTGNYPEDVYRHFVDEGYLSLSLPPSLGGSGLGVGALTVITEEAAKVSAAAGLMLLLSRLPAAPILKSGTDQQIKHWVEPLGQGRTRGAFAMSEPHAGSDVLSISTRAYQEGDSWRLDGRKSWISGAAEADWFVVVATIAPDERRPEAIRAFIVDADSPGLSTAKRHERPGCRGVSLGDIDLEGVAVSDDRRIPGIDGIGPLLGGLAMMRPVVSARGTGLASAALMLATDRLEKRIVGGRPLFKQQGLQWRLSDVALKLESARLLTARAASLIDSGESGSSVAGYLAMAKLASSEIAVEAAALVAQVHGAEGCLSGHPVDRFVRDARQLTIVEGTSEIQRNIIAKSVLDRNLWWDARSTFVGKGKTS